jgi:tripartite-type tricarboxylate transporter receptor subunit TctC
MEGPETLALAESAWLGMCLEEPAMKRGIWMAWMLGTLAILLAWLGSVAAWEPQKPVEFVIPAGSGGGADVMARFILRGIFGAPGIPREAQEWYVQVLKKVTETTEWQEFTANGGLKKAFLSGPEFRTWLETTEALHKELMAKGGLLKK